MTAHHFISLALALWWTQVPLTLAQLPRPTLTADNVAVNRSIVSPEVTADGHVVLRIYAPKASEVEVVGHWLRPASPIPLTKDERGVWSVTIGPLAPDYYLYSFRVDGVQTIDPKNAAVKPGIAPATHQSELFVPGPGTEFMANRPVPHGEVRMVWYRSAVMGMQRRMHVYTPPDYDPRNSRYPVLYLLHGGGDHDSAWTGVGRAAFIMDNLFAENSAIPMLIVMPEIPVPPARELFGEELLQDILPEVERRYHVQSTGRARAIAGLSVGGYQTLQLLTSHPGEFAHVAVWSAPVEGKTVDSFEKEQLAFLKNAMSINKAVKSVVFRIGKEDAGLPHVQRLSDLLTKHGIKNDLRILEGGHRWDNWRRYLRELAPSLFR